MNNTELNCRWLFANRPGGLDKGPNDAASDHFRGGRYVSLIREAIQNSLDAVLDPSQPLRMELAVGTLRREDFPQLFELQTYIKACMEMYPQAAAHTYGAMLERLQQMGNEMTYLRVSDYNATGMGYKNLGTQSPFYSFMKAEGLSTKSNDSAGGSYGYGKATLYLLSPLNAILVSTMTVEGEHVFEGAAHYCSFVLDGQRKEPAGFYGMSEAGEPINDNQLIPPPLRRNEPGTDIYILGFDSNDTEQMMDEALQALLQNFWMAIEKDKLRVMINGCNEVTKDKLPDRMAIFNGSDTHASAQRDITRYDPAPYWNLVRTLDDADDKEKPERMHLFRGELETVGTVRLYVETDPEAVDTLLRLRQNLMVIDIDRPSTRGGYRAVLVCDDEQGNKYLRQLENPAHNEWKIKNWNDQSTKAIGTKVLKQLREFVRQSLESLFDSAQGETLEIAGLEDMLYAVDQEGKPQPHKPDTDPVGTPDGTKTEQGSSPTTTINPNTGQKSHEKPNHTTGLVLPPYAGPTKTDSEGQLMGGGGSTAKPSKTKGGAGAGGSATPGLDGHTQQTYDSLRVNYRTIATREKGEMVHYLCIYSPVDVKQCRIVLKDGGESKDYDLNIRESSAGVVHGSRLDDVDLEKGENVLQIKLHDSGRHHIRLTAHKPSEKDHETQ